LHLGLALNEMVINVLKYAFPEERAGTVRVRFAREGNEFVLAITDDGIGLPREGETEGRAPAAPRGSGLGPRLLHALAAQLRGSFSRRPGEGSIGTFAELRFPAGAARPPPGL
jgi:two-component sensor histidine kinase